MWTNPTDIVVEQNTVYSDDNVNIGVLATLPHYT